MTTPEGKVKDKLRKLLKSYGADLYQFWPVQSRWGTRTLDVICWHLGVPFAVEAKRRGKDLTEYQQSTTDDMLDAGACVFRVSDDDELNVLKNWLDAGYDVFD